jgi:peptidoglycan/LPS O-acetylase OafA/YrhL
VLVPSLVCAPEQQRSGRIPELDGIRGIAILLVMLCHFGVIFCPSKRIGEGLGFGWIGVNLFFGLSGFLITGILLDSRGSYDYFRRFYARRLFRIFPVYYSLLFFFFHVGPLLSRFPSMHMLARDRGQEWRYWTYLMNWSAFNVRSRTLAHLWSLCVEEQFYIFWPVVIRYAPRRSLKWICLLIAILSPLARFIAFASGVSPIRIYGETVFRLDGLALGALIAIAQRDVNLHRVVERFWKPLAILACVAMAVILLRDGEYFQGRAMQVIGGSALSVISAAAVLLARKESRLLPSPILRSFGKYSYAIYAWHYLLAVCARASFQGELRWSEFVCVLVGSITVCWAVGWISWTLIEAPAAWLRDHLLIDRKQMAIAA